MHLPHLQYALAGVLHRCHGRGPANLARYDGVHYGYRARAGEIHRYVRAKTRSRGSAPEVKRRIMLGTYALSCGYYDAYYLKALKVRRLIKQDFERAFERCDVIVTPTAPTPAFKLGEKTSDPLAMYLADIYTISANLAGIPGVGIPCGFSRGGLPIGLQLMGKHFAEGRLLRWPGRTSRRRSGIRRRRNWYSESCAACCYGLQRSVA